MADDEAAEVAAEFAAEAAPAAPARPLRAAAAGCVRARPPPAAPPAPADGDAPAPGGGVASACGRSRPARYPRARARPPARIPARRSCASRRSAIGDRRLAGGHGEARGRSRRLVARRAVGRRCRRRRELPRRRARRAARRRSRRSRAWVRRSPGGLSGLIREEDGRLAIRLTPLVPPEDDTRPWRCPLVDPGRVPLGAGARRDAAARTRSRSRCSARSGAPSRACRGPEAVQSARRSGGRPVRRPPIRPRAIRPRLRAMGDLFDEFMRELERRRAEAEGRAPKDDSGDPEGPDDARRARPGRRRRRGDRRRHAADEPAAADDDDDRAAERDDEPTPRQPPARAARRRSPPAVDAGSAGTPPPKTGPRPVGGPDDGAGPPSVGHIVRRAGIGDRPHRDRRDPRPARRGHRPLDRRHLVQERRLRQRVLDAPRRPGGLFVGRRLARAGRAAAATCCSRPARAARRSRAAGPPPDRRRPARRGPAPGRAQRPARARPAARSGRSARPARGRAVASSTLQRSTREDMPDLVPIGTWVIAGGRRARSRSASRAPCRARGRRCCCGSTACRSRRRRRSSDPVFGRDISFFLFELPFYRFVQSLVNGLLLASLAVAGARYLLATTARRRGVRDPRPRPPRGARRAVPAVGRLRLPARQVRARVQPGGRRDGRRPSPTPTRASWPTTS